MLAVFAAVPGHAQLLLDLPAPSQHAVVTQRVGITDITINYHRPLVNGRKVWDSLVPYGQVWRAGANENTVISLSDPVTVEGQRLDKGSYGLHMIPNAGDWTVIFSRNYTSWGSFTYDQKEDALRVQVKPQAAEMREALSYDFDDVSPTATVATLRWEKLAVPIHISIAVNDIVEAGLKNQMRGITQFTWFSWDNAANFLLTAKRSLPDALAYSDKSIGVEDRYENEFTKSQVLRAMGKTDEAKTTEAKALTLANSLQTHGYGRALMAQGRKQEAYTVFKTNAQKHPDDWWVHMGLARAASDQSDWNTAISEVKLAVAGAPADQKSQYEALVKRLQNHEDINK
jgi:tetratricopeptide (TPR) repeat protein